MKLFTLFSCSFLLVATVGSTSADTLTLTPDADTYTRSGHDAGSDPLLNIYGSGADDFMAYIRFDLSSLPVGAAIDSATFTVYYEPDSRADTITTGRFANFGLLDVSGNTPQDWDEATLAEGNEGQEYGAGTYATLTSDVTSGWLFNLDADNGANVTETIGGSAAGDPESLSGPDLVTFLNGQIADGGSATIISAIDAENGRGYGYASKDNSDSSLWPTLNITYTVVPEPSTLALFGLGLFGFVARLRRKI
jgi:rhamnogalacturonan endolyase